MTLPPLRPRTLALATVGFVAVAALGAAWVLLGPDPGAGVRAEYRKQQRTQASPTPTPRAAPAESATEESVDAVAIPPPGAGRGADFTPRTAAIPTDPELPPAPEPSPPPAGPLPAPPPVPNALLAGSLVAPADPSPPASAQPPRIAVAAGRYRFQNSSPSALRGVNGAGLPGGKGGYVPEKFAPETAVIDAALVNNVVSADTSVPVIAAVWTPFYSDGHRILECGDRLVGASNGAKRRDRLAVTFTRVIRVSDRKSYPITAIALSGADGSLGIPGKTVGSVLLNALGPILLEAAVGFTSTLQQRVLVGSGGVQDGFATASGGVQVTPTLQNAGVGAGQGAMRKLQDLMVEDMEENRPYLVIPAGTRFQAMLTQPLDAAAPDYGR